jgi:hypothetical protein
MFRDEVPLFELDGKSDRPLLPTQIVGAPPS